MRSRPALLVLPAFVLALSACGGGGDDAASATSAAPAATGGLAKADYVTQAEAVCTRANTELAAQKTPTDLSQVDAYIDNGLTLAQKVSDDLAALPAPAADAADLKAKLTDPLAAKVTALRTFASQYREAAASSDPATAVGKIAAPTLPKPDSAYLTGYGFSACAQLAQAGT